MGALIGALHATLSADTANFEAGMKRAQNSARGATSGIQKSLGGIKTAFAGLAAGLSVGLFTNAIKNALEYAGSLGETAAQLGVTTRELQNFRFAAGQNGADIGEADKALGKFSLSISKALSGSEQMTKAFGAAGVQLSDLKNKSKGEILGQLADGFIKTGGASANAAAGVAIFGKGFQKIIPTLDLGSAGMNELAAANEALGAVLSDEQIQNADRTADKLRQVKEVLSAQIAGVVADNSAAIFDLANAFLSLAGSIGPVIRELQRAGIELGAFIKAGANLKNPFKAATDASRVFDFHNRLEDSLAGKHLPVSSSGNPAKFLAGPGKKASEDHSKEDALRAEQQFAQELSRANIDILNAKKDLATDYIEQTTIAIQIKDAEKAAFDQEQAYQVELYKLTKGKQGQSQAQADQLKALNDSKDALERQAILDEEAAHRQKDTQELIQSDYDRRRNILEAQASIAETASERRKVELEILELAYQQKRQALQNVIDTSKDGKAIEDARRDLINLKATHSLDQQNVIQQTRGPMEDFLASLPTTAAKANEALQQLEVQGFDGLIDSVLALSEGFGKAKESLLDTLKQFLIGLAKIELQKALGNILQGVKLPGFASGGFTGNISPNKFAGFVHGSEGVLNASAMHRLGVPALNALNRGASISAVTSNDNSYHRGSRGDVYMTVLTPDADSFRRSEGQTTRSLKRRLG